ncbi:MAG: tripartite tricarboxylate transporter substrate binding protein [Candidatus Protistobacter heckmanni]|nr:tripartite tricarboxylate transporter substrate binding protein [Candidatus Protistobacter heckmanni]
MRQTPMLRKFCAAALALAAAAGFWSAPAAAQDFPKNPVKIIIPFPPGGPTDTVARLIGQKLQEIWSQPVIIDYKPGGSTMIGVDYIAKSAPDGYTIGIVNSSFAVNPSLHKTMAYNTLKDLSGVTQLANLQLAIVARTDALFNNVAEMIAYAKKHPGQLTYGTPGAGSTTHLGMELLKRTAGIDILHSPFKGSAPAHTELMGGRIDLVVDPFLSILPYVQSGRMKMIATLGDKRVPGYESKYPTVSETIPGFNVNALLGFIVAAGTPRAAVAKIQADTARVLAIPEVKKRVEELGMEVVASKPEQFDAMVQADMKKWARIVTEAKITVE